MNSARCRILLIAFSVALCSGTLMAQSGKITGTVRDASSREAVVGASIVLDGTVWGVAADANGVYFVLNVPPGTYKVTASAVGYAKKSVINVRVGTDQIVTIDFDMQSEAIGLEEVIVEAQQRTVDPSQTSAKTRITSDELLSLPIRQVSDIIATSASVYKGFIRGGKQNETKTIIDGIDVTDQFYAPSADIYMVYNGVTRQRESNKSSLVDLTITSVEEANVLTGGVGADFATATAGLISYSLREGRGVITGGARFKMSSGGGLRHFGPDVYNDATRYLNEKATLAASASATDRDKATRYRWYPGKYSYGIKPTYDLEVNAGGGLTEDLGIYLTGGVYETYGRFPGEKFKRANGSLKASYNLTSDMRINAIGMLEDRGRLFGWRNRNYVEDFRFFLEGAPQYDGYSFIGSLKFTHVLSPSTFYEIQASTVNDNTRRGYVDGNNDGYIDLREEGEFLTFKDTAQVNRYMASGGGTQFTKFFSPTPRNESGSESPFLGRAWKIARPGIYYEDFTNSNLTLKGDIVSQYTVNHQLRGGVQVRMHNIERELRAGYIGGVFPTYKNYIEEAWNIKPTEMSAYVQDKMEYAGLIINVGGRLDAIDYDAADYANFFGPFKDITDASGGSVRVPVRGDKIPMKFYFSPRVGVSHPISDRAAMYFSFARQTQPQAFSRLFSNYNDFGNPSLPVVVRVGQDPIRSTNYDLGIQWAFLEGFGLDLSAYYRDIENYGAFSWNIIPRAPWRLYIITTNFGYADSRGVELTVRKNVENVTDFLSIGGRMTYSYSYIKQANYTGGGAASFSSVAGDSTKYNGQLPFDDVRNYNTIEQNVQGVNSSLTGGYDRPHRITYTLFFRFPQEITLSSIGRFQSGFYYPKTLGDPRARELGVGPWTSQIDLRLEKLFEIGSIARVSVYLDILNIFNAKNILAYDNSPTGQLIWERSLESDSNPYIRRVPNPTGYDATSTTPQWTGRPMTQDGSMIYDIPREIYFGFNIFL